MTIINNYLPNYDFNEYHSKSVNGTKEEIINAIKTLKTSEISSIMDFLMSIRALTIKKKRTKLLATNELLLEEMQRNNFYILEESDNEIVIGLIGKFWNLTNPSQVKITSADEYLNFNKEKYGIVATNFLVEEKKGSNILSTETRIKIEDSKSRRKFAIYWFFIYLGSSLIRKILLNAISKKVEKSVSQ